MALGYVLDSSPRITQERGRESWRKGHRLERCSVRGIDGLHSGPWPLVLTAPSSGLHENGLIGLGIDTIGSVASLESVSL